jgi:hypothetical protein
MEADGYDLVRESSCSVFYIWIYLDITPIPHVHVTLQPVSQNLLQGRNLHIQPSAGGTTANQVDDAQCPKSESVFTEDQSL